MAFEGSFEDRLALRDLLDAYADAVNRADSEAWAATWDEGGLWSLPGFGIIEGKAKIVDTWLAAMRAFPDIVFRAWPGSIEVLGETAAMRSYTEETFPTFTGPSASMTTPPAGSMAGGCLRSGGFRS